MAKLTKKQKYQRALEARGYMVDHNTKVSRYLVMIPTQGARSIYKQEHRILLGDGGALRVTGGTVATSRMIREAIAERLILEGERSP